MAILIDYDPAGLLMQLSADAGTAMGNAQRLRDRAGEDAYAQRAAIDSAARSAAAPTYAQQNTARGQTRYDSPGVETFVNEEERARSQAARSQYEAVYGSPAEQKARGQMSEALNRFAQTRKGDPAAQQVVQQAVRTGAKVPAPVESAAYGVPLTQDIRQREQNTAQFKAETDRMKATAPQTPRVSAADLQKANQRRLAAFDSDPSVVIQALQAVDPMTGGPSPVMVDMMAGLNDPAIPPAQRLQRAAMLAASGAPEGAIKAMRDRAWEQQKQEMQRQQQEAQTREKAETAAAGLVAQLRSGEIAVQDIPAKAQQLGIPPEMLEEVIGSMWEKAGQPLAPLPKGPR